MSGTASFPQLGSSGSKLATVQYKCSTQSTQYILAAPACKSQLLSTSVVREVYFGSSGSKVAILKYKIKCAALMPYQGCFLLLLIVLQVRVCACFLKKGSAQS